MDTISAEYSKLLLISLLYTNLAYSWIVPLVESTATNAGVTLIGYFLVLVLASSTTFFFWGDRLTA